MKKILLFILLSFCSTVFSQVPVSSSMLVGTKWVDVSDFNSDFGYETYYSFSKSCMIWTESRDRSFSFSYKYYLSDSKPTRYDKSKVGKVSRGSYLVQYNEKSDDLVFFTIKQFNKKTGHMQLLYEPNPQRKRLGNDTYTLYELKLVKK